MKKQEAKKQKVNKHPDWQMTGSERRWYYAGDSGRMFAASIISQYMTVFLMFQSISTAAVATSMLVVKIIDALDDVVFGFFIDKFNPQNIPGLRRIAGKGKYMPWYRSTFWTFPMATILFFLMPNSLSDGAKIAWFTVFYLLYDLTCTLSEVPMNSMVMTLTESPTERTQILTVKGVIMVVAAIAFAVVSQFLISEAVGLPITSVAIGFSVMFLLLMLPMCFKVKEHNTELKNVESEKVDEKYTLKDMAQCVITNKYILISFLSTLVFSCLQTGAGVQVFIGFYVFHDSNLYSMIMLLAFIPGIILSALSSKIVAKVGKRNGLIGIMLIAGVCTVIQYFMFGKAKTIFIIIGAICAIPNAVFAIMRQYIAPDTIEYTRYKTGKDCSGIFYALNSFITKATAGVASAMALYILTFSGWKEMEATSFADLAAQGATQTPEAIQALWNCGYLIPAIGAFAAAIILFFYKLRDSDAELMGKCNAGTITREECEAQLSRKY